jgi:hypothetical protein
LPGTCAVVGPWYAAAGTGARTVRQHRAGDVAHGDTDDLLLPQEGKRPGTRTWSCRTVVGAALFPGCQGLEGKRTRVRAARPLTSSLWQIDVRCCKGRCTLLRQPTQRTTRSRRSAARCLRHYGLLAHRYRAAKLKLSRQLLGVVTLTPLLVPAAEATIGGRRGGGVLSGAWQSALAGAGASGPADGGDDLPAAMEASGLVARTRAGPVEYSLQAPARMQCP